MASLERLRELLYGRRVTPRVPSGRFAHVSSEEEADVPLGRDASSSWSAFILYIDASGNRSERRVTCHQLSGFGKVELIRGFCHERKALRSFRVDRIQELVCADSGEVLDPIVHFENLRLRGALNVEDTALTEIARAMVFLAHCDGAYHPLEKSALEELFERYALRFGGDDRLIEATMGNVRRLAPDDVDILRCLGKFAKATNGPALCRFVLDSSASMIDADGRHAPEEIRWAIEFSSVLKSIADRRA